MTSTINDLKSRVQALGPAGVAAELHRRRRTLQRPKRWSRTKILTTIRCCSPGGRNVHRHRTLRRPVHRFFFFGRHLFHDRSLPVRHIGQLRPHRCRFDVDRNSIANSQEPSFSCRRSPCPTRSMQGTSWWQGGRTRRTVFALKRRRTASKRFIPRTRSPSTQPTACTLGMEESTFLPCYRVR